MNPLQALHPYGQAVWLDYIRPSLITSGELQRLVHEDGVRGVTSNPAIFGRTEQVFQNRHRVLKITVLSKT